MKNLPLIILFLATAFCAAGQSGTKSNEGLAKLFKNIDRPRGGGGGEGVLYRGQHPKGKWSTVSFQNMKTEADSTQLFISQLERIDDATLNDQEKISKAVMLIRLRDQVDAVKYKMVLIPFNAEGGFYNQMSFVLPRLTFKTAQDYFDYFKWLPEYETRLRDNIALMRQGIKEGIVAPKIIVNNTLLLLKPWVPESYEATPFYAPLNNIPSTISAGEQAQIKKEGGQAIGRLYNTYRELKTFFEKEYMAAAKDQPGIMFVPGGKEYYENRIKHYTTLPLSADSIHKLGLAEVARIRSSMEKIIADLKFQGSFADFLAFLRSDPQFYAKTPQELLNYASWLSKKAEGQLPRLFNKLYSLPFTVEPVPDNIAPTYTGGRYVPGSLEGKRAGTYWVNTYDLKSRTLYTLPALTVHEAVPGHHLQGAIAGELKDIPAFRNRYYISAFGEGWGLYSEFLGEEMGMYPTPYDMFGRYTYEMWRACRLVVDTGIHYKGWSRDQALKYLSENTALSMHEVTTEIDRYIGWPGQAVSYKVGEIKIKDLRKKAEDKLGTSFNIGDFHQTILQNGSVPLTVLEQEVDRYIARTSEKKDK